MSQSLKIRQLFFGWSQEFTWDFRIEINKKGKDFCIKEGKGINIWEHLLCQEICLSHHECYYYVLHKKMPGAEEEVTPRKEKKELQSKWSNAWRWCWQRSFLQGKGNRQGKHEEQRSCQWEQLKKILLRKTLLRHVKDDLVRGCPPVMKNICYQFENSLTFIDFPFTYYCQTITMKDKPETWLNNKDPPSE